MICGSSRFQPRQRIEHHHAVGHLLRRAHVVRHHDAGDRMMLARAEDQLVDHVAHDRVEPGGGLVVEHDLGLHRQGAGQSDPFSHAAGKLGRLLAHDVLGQSHLGQPGQHDPPNLFGRLARVLPQRKGDVLGDRHAVEQGRLLEEEAEADPLPGQLLLAQFGEVPAVEMDRAAAGTQQPDDRLQQHRLAAPALADHGQGLAAGNRQADAAQHVLPAELHAHLLQLDQRTMRIGDVGGSSDHTYLASHLCGEGQE